jgi:hypothetical protein
VGAFGNPRKRAPFQRALDGVLLKDEERELVRASSPANSSATEELLRQPAAWAVVPGMISLTWVMADAAMPTISIAYTGRVGPFHDHHAAHDQPGTVDIYDTPDHRAMRNMTVNNVPVVSTPAVPNGGLAQGRLG